MGSTATRTTNSNPNLVHLEYDFVARKDSILKWLNAERFSHVSGREEGVSIFFVQS